MQSTNYSGQEGIDVEPRTRRACEGDMVVVPHGGTTGLFDVYSANGGENEIYTVDLRDEVCECPDHVHRDANCKHQRRVRLALGIADVPAADGVDVDIEIDGVLANSRAKYATDTCDTDTERDAQTPDSGREQAVATDGGQAVDETPDQEHEHEQEYTVHREPLAQGGQKYARCTGCGREVLPVGRFETLIHDADCPHANSSEEAT